MARALAPAMPRPVLQLHAGDMVRIRGERWTVVRQSGCGDVSVVDVRGAEAANVGGTSRFLLPFEAIERGTTPRAPKVVRPTEWRTLARAALATATPRVESLRAAARATFDVMPYQLEPALAVTSGLGCRLLLADEVGLGKTVQAALIVAELLERTPDGHALVICPAGLRSQWQEELRRRFALDATVLDSAGVSRLASALDGSANPWSAAPLVIASIDFIKRPEVMRALEGLIWDVVVLDEAHNLATRSDRSTAAAAIASRARTIVMLSATPHSGDDTAFARLCSLGDVHGKFPLLLFRRTRADAGIPVLRRMRWLRVRPTAAEEEMHEALVRYSQRVWQERPDNIGARLGISVLLRRALSSASSLARSVERRLASRRVTQTSPGQLVLPFANNDSDDEPADALAAPGLADAEDERRHLEHVLRLAWLAATQESKTAVLRRWLLRVREPVLIFTEYRDTLVQLRQVLSEGDTSEPAGHRLTELHGGLTRSERERAAHLFVSGGADVLLATDAASEGLNLHRRCRCVINLEVPWSPVRLEQRIGRVDRIGQPKCVHAINLVAGGTLEAAGLRRLLDRAHKAASALNGREPTEVEVADAVLTGVDILDTHQTTPPPAELRRPDLSAVAAEEATRITTCRRLHSRTPVSERRPFATTLGRSRRPHSVWAFELVVTDADAVPLWRTLIGVAGISCGPASSPSDVRATVARVLERLRSATDPMSRHVLSTCTATVRAQMAIGTDREQAIAAAIRLRHARIAADLLQPGLFDRRAERRAAAQSLVLEEALGRCNERLDALARLVTLDVEPPALRFAVLIP